MNGAWGLLSGLGFARQAGARALALGPGLTRAKASLSLSSRLQAAADFTDGRAAGD